MRTPTAGGGCPFADTLTKLTVRAGVVHTVHGVLTTCNSLRDLEYLCGIACKRMRLFRIHNDYIHGVRTVIALIATAGTRHVADLPRHSKPRRGNNLLIQRARLFRIQFGALRAVWHTGNAVPLFGKALIATVCHADQLDFTVRGRGFPHNAILAAFDKGLEARSGNGRFQAAV